MEREKMMLVLEDEINYNQPSFFDEVGMGNSPMVQYRLEDGTVVKIPRFPISKADMAIPGWVTRPDGKQIFVEDCDDEE
jgi:hypothetical protein